jgi:YbgC/YbaW family acyl-CoA thioester hydrolase
VTPVFRTQRIVEFGDTDMAGIVHFANFFRFMEAAEHAFLRSRGLSVLTEWEGEPISFPRVAASCDYLRPARFGDELEITVAIKNLGRSSLTYSFDILKGQEKIARGQVTAVCCRFVQGKPPESREIPATFRESLLGQQVHNTPKYEK